MGATKRKSTPTRKPRTRAPKAPAPVELSEIQRTTLVADPPPVSLPGAPSTRPDRPPVPARPTGFAATLGANLLGRPFVGLQQYREPPVHEGGAEIDMCADCDVDCCSGHVIPVNIFDAWRLRSVLNIPFREFLGLVPHQQGSPTHPVRMHDGKYTLMLKRRADKSCGFLIKMGSQRRCGVHALRPDACRIFPFLPDLEIQEKAVGDELVQMHPSHCPWKWPPTTEHKARVLRDIRDNTDHRAIDREVLTRWYWVIGVERTVENFFEFLEDEVPRVMLRPDEPSRYLASLW